jgi:N-methylhydantoinase A/oxoprolinase/acetone carboxylase beta subunit
VETILSGPAASLTGGQALARIDECFVIDMGGTSTDIAILDKGQPRLESEGAMIGGWRTRVRAIDIWTAGLGGDSRVWIDLDGIRVGPSRVLPLAEACVHYPGLLAKMRSEGRVEHLVALSRDPKGLGEGERAVFDLVAAEGPISEDELVERLPDVYLARDYVKRLIERTHLLGTGMTPTDALHVTGSYLHGDREGSQFGAEMLGSMIGMTAEELARAVIESTSRRVAEEVAKKAILDASGEVPAGVLGEYVLGQVTGAERGGEMVLRSTLDRPIIGIGAPAEAFLPETARMLGARIVVPPHHDVGNAVGAVCSVVADEVVVEIHHRDLKFQVYAPGKEPVEFMHAEEAVLEAKERAERIARERVEDAGGVEVRVAVEVKVIRCRAGIRNVRELVNWVEVHARATGKPACASSLTKG